MKLYVRFLIFSCLISFIIVLWKVVSAAGAVKHDEIVDMVSRLFRNFSRDPTTAEQLVEANPAIFTGSEVCCNSE